MTCAGEPRVLLLCTGNSCRSRMAEGMFAPPAGTEAEVQAVFRHVFAAYAAGWREGLHAGRSREKQV